MTQASKIALALTAAMLPLLPLSAQEADATEVVATPEDVRDDMTLLDRWNADRTTFFDASEIDLSELQYVARPLVVFADSPADPLFVQQLELLRARPEGLIARDVILIVDADPNVNSDARAELRPRGFTLVLIGKDCRVAQRKPAPFGVRELERAIDKMPLRQQEVRDGRALSE